MPSADKVFIPDPKRAETDPGILQVIRDRWSPYRFQPQSLTVEQLQRCFQAASWAASSYNEQPWFFVAAIRAQEGEFQRILGCLLDANQEWAKFAGALILTFTQETFSRNGQPNRVHQHDLGQAAAHFALQATELGIAVHQMAGIHIGKIRSEFQVPDGFVPQTAIAAGFPARDTLNGQESLEQRDMSARHRKPLSQFVFHGGWGKAFS